MQTLLVFMSIGLRTKKYIIGDHAKGGDLGSFLGEAFRRKTVIFHPQKLAEPPYGNFDRGPPPIGCLRRSFPYFPAQVST